MKVRDYIEHIGELARQVYESEKETPSFDEADLTEVNAALEAAVAIENLRVVTRYVREIRKVSESTEDTRA